MGSSLASKSNCLFIVFPSKKKTRWGIPCLDTNPDGSKWGSQPPLACSIQKFEKTVGLISVGLLMQPRDHFGKESLNQMPKLHSFRVGWCNVQGNPTGTLQIAAEALWFLFSSEAEETQETLLVLQRIAGRPGTCWSPLSLWPSRLLSPPKKFPAKTRQQMPLSIFLMVSSSSITIFDGNMLASSQHAKPCQVTLPEDIGISEKLEKLRSLPNQIKRLEKRDINGVSLVTCLPGTGCPILSWSLEECYPTWSAWRVGELGAKGDLWDRFCHLFGAWIVPKVQQKA